MSIDKAVEQESLDDDQLDSEFDDAWDEDDALDSDADDDNVDDEQDTNSDDDAVDDEQAEADADKGTPDDADTDEKPAGDNAGEGGDEPTDEKDVQREKSWAGRLEKREAELARKEQEFQEKQDGRRKKIRELMAADDDDTDWDTLSKAAEELEMPEFSMLAKKVKKLEEAQLTHIESAEAQSEFEAESTKVRTENTEYRQHVETISEKHPGFFNTVNTPEFNGYLDTLDPIARTGADMVLQKGDAGQVIALLDSYKNAQSNPKPKQSDPAASLASPRRGASRPRSEVDMNDFDAAWDEDDD